MIMISLVIDQVIQHMQLFFLLWPDLVDGLVSSEVLDADSNDDTELVSRDLYVESDSQLVTS